MDMDGARADGGREGVCCWDRGIWGLGIIFARVLGSS